MVALLGMGLSSVSGDIGSGVIGGVKTITWDAKTDFPNQQIQYAGASEERYV